MKNLVVIMLPAIALLLTACPEGGKSPKIYMGLKGEIALITETTSTADDGAPGEMAGVVRYTFDKQGNLLSQISSDEQDIESHRVLYEYENGVCVRTASLSRWGDVVRIDSLKKRKKNIEVWEERNNGPIYRTEFVRDGDRVTVTKFRNEDVMSTEYRHLNKQGNVISTRLERGGKIIMQSEASYDANGNELLNTMFRDDKRITTTYAYYDYDSKGNWTRRTTVVGNSPVTITIREIEYVK